MPVSPARTRRGCSASGRSESLREWLLRWSFKIGVILKGLDGLLETAGGLLFLVVSRTELTHIVLKLTRPELLEDPDDLIANGLRHAFRHLTGGEKLFGSIYLLAHGAIKIFLVVFLLRGKLWSYPTAVILLFAFIAYQVYRVSVHFSWSLLALTGLDALIVLLVWHEYLHLKHRRGTVLPRTLAGEKSTSKDESQ